MSRSSILIVEDERIIARSIEKRLAAAGYHVAGLASNGDDAVKMAFELAPDLILMDINLGHGFDGVEVAEWIKTKRQVPIVFLTAHADDATLQRAKLVEPAGYVLKPYEDKDLETAIEIGLYKHQADCRVRENEQWLGATLASIGDGVIATNQHGHVRFLNQAAECLTGWSQAHAIGRNVRDVFYTIEAGSRRETPSPVVAALSRRESIPLGEELAIIDARGDRRFVEGAASPTLGADGQVIGAVVAFRDVSERRRLEEQLENYRRELEEANVRLESLVVTDGLTHLKNRRAFETRLDEELSRARRTRMPLSLLMADVDHFKSFNDQFGHPAGDRVLRNVSRLLEGNARSTDFVARYGGEEFVLLLPNTDESGAMVLAERMRRAVEQGTWLERPITVSVGAASHAGAPEQDSTLLADADAALYQSKRRGRNLVSHAAQVLSAKA